MPQSKQQEDKNDSQAVLASPIFPFPFRVVNYVSQQNESIVFSTFAIFGYSLNSVEKYFNLVKKIYFHNTKL
jgi:hypothetical protein